jgi:predicted nucleotide-binding protein
LVRHAHEVDFAVIIVSTDDLRDSRGSTSLIPRENVMLECGLFMGALERDRAFVLAQNDRDLALPSDLKGVTALFFSNEDELAEKLQEISETVDRKGRMLRYCKVL